MTEAELANTMSFPSIKKLTSFQVQNSWIGTGLNFKSDLLWEWAIVIGRVIGLVWGCRVPCGFFCGRQIRVAGRGVFCFWAAWRFASARL